MIELGVTFGLYVLASTVLIGFLMRAAARERASLESRLMAMTKPEALITHEALEHPTPAEVGYVDENREFALQHGRENIGLDLAEDDDG